MVDVIRDDKRVLPYVKTMKVINMDFLGLEPFVFSFGQTNVLAKLFNLRTKQHAEAILQRIAARVRLAVSRRACLRVALTDGRASERRAMSS